MVDSIFRFDTRVLMCAECSAPIQSEVSGGTVKCAYCGAVNHLAPRKETAKEPIMYAEQIADDARFEILKQQLNRPVHFSDTVKPLLNDGEIASFKLEESLHIWRTAFQQLSTGDDFEQSEMLLQLTVLLGKHFERTGEDLKQRSLFENALEVLTLPRHRQVLRCHLAQQAALGNDLDAAERWIAPCDPKSSDLQSAGAFYIARAVIDTVKKDWQAVLSSQALHSSSSPFVSSLTAKGALLRADAMENLGRNDDAVMHLALYAKSVEAKLDPFKREVSWFRKYGVVLCPRSHAPALALWNSYRQAKSAHREHEDAISYIGAILFLIFGLPALAIDLFVIFTKGTSTVVFLAIGVSFTIIGISWLRSRRKADRFTRAYKKHLLYSRHLS